MKRIYEITYTHQGCSENGGHKVSTMAEGPTEALAKFTHMKPFKTIMKIEMFPQSEELM